MKIPLFFLQGAFKMKRDKFHFGPWTVLILVILMRISVCAHMHVLNLL